MSSTAATGRTLEEFSPAHLKALGELWIRSALRAGLEDPEHIDAEFYGYQDEGEHCWRCNGRGYLIVCPDDMCHGMDECIHGDGEITCPECHGEGELYPTGEAAA